jgi:peroxiredoxin Q/BCP
MKKVGDFAPEIGLPASDGKVFSLADRKGRYTIVYFFPAAFTPGCTAESKRFRDNSSELAALGADVVGISTDSHQQQCAFAESLRVTFPMVGDADGRITRAYGVKWPIFDRARRVTFVVGPTRHIEAVFAHEIQVNRHLDDVVAFFKKANVRAAE